MPAVGDGAAMGHQDGQEARDSLEGVGQDSRGAARTCGAAGGRREWEALTAEACGDVGAAEGPRALIR